MFEVVSVVFQAIGRTFGNIFWSAMGAIICQLAYDWSVSGTLVWNFVANDVMGTNNTEARKNAEAISSAMALSRGLWFAMLLVLWLTFCQIFVETRRIFSEKATAKAKKGILQNGLKLSEDMVSGDSVSVNIDPADDIIQRFENHLDYQYETNRDNREFCRDVRTQWQIRNRHNAELTAAMRGVQSELQIFNVEARRMRYEADFRRS